MHNDSRVQSNIVMTSEGLLAEMEFKAFFEFIGGSLEQVMQKNLNSHEVKYMKKYDEGQRKDYSHMKLEEMISIKKLGQG
jgi:cGMP-dependent protein kinase